MYEITWQNILDTAKDEVVALTAFTLSQQELILSETYCAVPPVYGEWTTILRRYYATHVAVQSTLESAGEGAETTEVIGSVSTNKNQPVNNPSSALPMRETTYGRQYDFLSREYKNRFQGDFGVYSGGSLLGFHKIIPTC